MNELTTSQTIFCVIFFVAMFLLYIFRNANFVFAMLWRVVSMFFVVLFAILFANYAKKEIKDWWSK